MENHLGLTSADKQISHSLTLWDIETGIVELLAAREDADTPEAIAAVDQALTEYVQREVQKVDRIRGLLKQCEMVAYAARQEARDQEKRARMWEARRDRVKALVYAAMDATGAKQIEGRTGTLLLKGNGGLAPLVITDESQIPEECCKYVGWIGGKLWQQLREAKETQVLEYGSDFDTDDMHMTRTVDNDRVRRALPVPGAHLGERGRHVEVK